MTDHKIVGLQYAFTALGFLFVGFLLMLVMRWQLAWPTAPLPPVFAATVAETNAPGGYMVPEFYNQLVAMHGTVMIFLAVVPLLTGAFGNYLVLSHDGRGGSVHWRDVSDRVGAPHVADRHGHHTRFVFSDHDGDHLGALGGAGDLADALSVGRFNSLHDTDALRTPFLPMFGIGGLAGLPLGLAASDVTLHDTWVQRGNGNGQRRCQRAVP